MLEPTGAECRPIAYVDIETTELHPELRLAWNIGIVVRTSDGAVRETEIFVADIDLSNANERSLEVGHFYQRHPQYRNGFDHPINRGDSGLLTERDAALVVERWTREAIFAGIVPSFDALTLDAMLRRHGLKAGWHYALLDVCTFAAGSFYGRAMCGEPLPDPMPRTPEEISAACGVPLLSSEERHTALGDARWAMRLHEHTLKGAGAQ
uniref:hypothetical protein n=1 Tax=Nocardia suismassiliense TaxID=2077092 RepID=UPI003F49A937